VQSEDLPKTGIGSPSSEGEGGRAMDDRMTMQFNYYLEQQCMFCQFAYESLVLEEMKRNKSIDRMWFSVQNLLTAAGNISKVFWPAQRGAKNGSKRARYVERGRKLRERLGVKDNSPLQSRRLRDTFEHYDERMQDWLGDNPNKGFSESGVFSGCKVPEFPDWHLRSLVLDTKTVIYLEESVSLRQIVDEAGQLLKMVQADVTKLRSKQTGKSQARD
jgi:hypothetical protein